MAMTRSAGKAMQVLSIPFIAWGFVALLLMLLNSGFEGPMIFLWPGSMYLAVFALGFWMLKRGQRASRQK